MIMLLISLECDLVTRRLPIDQQLRETIGHLTPSGVKVGPIGLGVEELPSKKISCSCICYCDCQVFLRWRETEGKSEVFDETIQEANCTRFTSLQAIYPKASLGTQVPTSQWVKGLSMDPAYLHVPFTPIF